MNKGDVAPYDGVLVGNELYVEMMLKLARADACYWDM